MPPDGLHPHQTLAELAAKAIQEQQSRVCVFPTNLGTTEAEIVFSRPTVGVYVISLRVGEVFPRHEHRWEAESLTCFDGEGEVRFEDGSSKRLIAGIPVPVTAGLSHEVEGILAGGDGERCWVIAVAVPRPEGLPNGPNTEDG